MVNFIYYSTRFINEAFKMSESIPKEISELSKKFKVVWKQKEEGDPWDEITGKIEIGRKVDIEKLLKEKGFEGHDI